MSIDSGQFFTVKPVDRLYAIYQQTTQGKLSWHTKQEPMKRYDTYADGKKLHNLKVENYVLFCGYSEDFKPRRQPLR